MFSFFNDIIIMYKQGNNQEKKKMHDEKNCLMKKLVLRLMQQPCIFVSQ